MKKIAIIDTYPSNITQEKILKECIEKIKPLGYDIFLVSHYPIDFEIQKMVNYYVYDDNNVFLPPEYTPFYFMDTDSFYIKITNGGHTLPITRNMYTSLNLSKLMGYEFFYFIEFDILFGEDDLTVLNDLQDQMTSENKKMIFFKPIDFIECGSHVYETLFFGGDVNFFLEHFQPPIDLNDWLNKKMGYTLEITFFEKFSGIEDQYVIIPDHSHNFFKNSQVNVFRYGLFVCELLQNLTDDNKPCLYIHNSHVSPNDKYIKIIHNNTIKYDGKLQKSEWKLDSFSYDNSELIIYVFENEDDYFSNINYTHKYFIMNRDQIKKYNGTINFKN